MYSLDCHYFIVKFETLDELLDHIIVSGMDPNYEITRNGIGIGENAIDLITF